MNRDRILQLARESELDRQLSMEVPFVVDRLERFAALIEREVRGDAEPVAWLPLDEARFALWEAINKRKFGNPKDDKLILEYLKQNGLWIGKNAHPAPAVDAEPVAWANIRDDGNTPALLSISQHPEDRKHWRNPIPLYTHPAPAVVRQLVEALEDSEHYIVLDLARHDEAYDRHPSCEPERSQIVQDLEQLRAALAAAKGAGL